MLLAPNWNSASTYQRSPAKPVPFGQQAATIGSHKAATCGLGWRRWRLPSDSVNRWLLRSFFAVFGQPLDRGDTLAFTRREHDDALRRAPRDTDAVDGASNQLTAVGDQHDLIALLDGERSDQPAVLFRDRHGDDTFAAAAGGAVLV